jgi:molybdopterin converting factor subunit 1
MPNNTAPGNANYNRRKKCVDAFHFPRRAFAVTLTAEREMMPTMRILFFAQLKDVTKCDSVELPSPCPLTSDQLWTELLRRFPGLAGHRASVRLARNLEYVPAPAQFSDDDEVALIPPVSGG